MDRRSPGRARCCSALVAAAGLTERQVRSRLQEFTAVWSELFPAEQARIVQLLVARVEISATGADITLRTDGLGALMQDLRNTPDIEDEAA